MRGLFVGIVGAAAIGLCVLGLAENAGRAGPFDDDLAPVTITAASAGSYHAVPDREPFPGVCLDPPCDARASLDIRIVGLPANPYEAYLEGGTREHLGPLVRDSAGHSLRWSESADHTDKTRLAIYMAGTAVAAIPVRASDEPIALDGPITAVWPATTGRVHLNEIGGIVVSTVATIDVDALPPAGWEFKAALLGSSGVTELGTLTDADGRSTLEARVELLPLEDQQHIRIVLACRSCADDAGFPVLVAPL